MIDKRKQSAVAAVVTVLTVTSVMSPIASVYAIETDKAITQQTETVQIKENAPLIEQPENLTGMVGQSLQDVVLPENWKWADETTIISKDKTEYPARMIVDDVTYDYSNAEGYNAEEHYVEKIVAITVEPVKSESSKPVPEKSNRTLGDTPITVNTGNIEINSNNFPNKEFRNWLRQQDYGTDETITQDEISNITSINVTATLISDLKGIENFKNPNFLFCSGIPISNLDVSNNTALTTLDCSNTGISSLNVDSNTDLVTLYCNGTKISSLNLNKNTNLKTLRCEKTEIINLNVSENKALEKLWYSGPNLDVSKNMALKELYYSGTDTTITISNDEALTTLDCRGSKVSNLDISSYENLVKFGYSGANLNVSNNRALKELYYNGTDRTIDLSNNTNLKLLDCAWSGVTSLNLSKNTALYDLDLCGTSITSLNLNKNTNLSYLNLAGTSITSLDVSNNTALQWLDCSYTSLAYLNIGENSKITYLDTTNLKSVNVEVTNDTFNIEDKFPGIDKTNITKVSGTNYDDKTGIMSNYNVGTPITYTYDCGTYVTMDVTLTLTGSFITITEDLNKIYDGKAVNSTPTVNRSGSSGDVIYKWEQNNAGNWDEIKYAPTDAGTYRVTATLTSKDDFPEATSEPMEFTISQATNSWTNPLSIINWTYSETNNKPTAVAKFGTIDYLYSDSENGTYTDIAPINAGTWYVKAIVAGTDNYTGLESIKAFKIMKAKNTWLEKPVILDWAFGEAANMPTAKAKSGGTVNFTYSDSENGTYTDKVPTTAGTWYMKATVTESDNYTGLESIKAFKIMKAKDAWLEKPVILDWTFGEAANMPTAKAKSGGTVSFTYSDSENGTYTDKVPTTAGTWYMKATVAESNNYTGLETTLAFTIAPMNVENNPQITVSDIKNDKDVDNLVIKDGDKELVKDIDYTVDKKQDNNKVIVTITFKGNYTGTITKTYNVNVEVPKEEPKETVSTPTGDHSYMGLFATMSLLTAGCIAFLTGKKKGYKK